MSTFSGIGTALSSLIAQRQALDVTSQNVANVNTVGYTRQRATMVASPTAAVPSMFSTVGGVGDGVRVTGVSRLNDAFLDAQLRSASSAASYQGVRSTAYTTLETSLGEPGETSLSSGLQDMWKAWGDASNNPQNASTRQAVLDTSQAVVDKLGALYTDVRTQWTQARDASVSLVSQVNAAAANVADLNTRIQAGTNVGANVNELMDQRDQAITSLSTLAGATARQNDNGTVDVLVGGNPLVEGSRAHAVALAGATSFADAVGGTAVAVVWADRPTAPVSLTGGELAGRLSVLAPPDATGTGGVLAEAAARLDTVAGQLAARVNAVHGTGYRADGTPGDDFFSLDAGQPAALGLRIVPATTDAVALSGAAGAAHDGSIGDAVSQLGTATDGPGATWSTAVVELGTRSAATKSRATVAEQARASAETQQTSSAAVDTDEETVNLLAYQQGYQAAARVITTINSVLETLMNMAR